jgi:hypothetical protein
MKMEHSCQGSKGGNDEDAAAVAPSLSVEATTAQVVTSAVRACLHKERCLIFRHFNRSYAFHVIVGVPVNSQIDQ